MTSRIAASWHFFDLHCDGLPILHFHRKRVQVGSILSLQGGNFPQSPRAVLLFKYLIDC